MFLLSHEMLIKIRVSRSRARKRNTNPSQRHRQRQRHRQKPHLQLLMCVMLDGNPMFLLPDEMLIEIRVSRSRARKNERPKIAGIMNDPRRKRRTKLVWVLRERYVSSLS